MDAVSERNAALGLDGTTDALRGLSASYDRDEATRGWGVDVALGPKDGRWC